MQTLWPRRTLRANNTHVAASLQRSLSCLLVATGHGTQGKCREPRAERVQIWSLTILDSNPRPAPTPCVTVGNFSGPYFFIYVKQIISPAFLGLSQNLS